MGKLNEKGSVIEPQIEQMAWNFSFEEFFFLINFNVCSSKEAKPTCSGLKKWLASIEVTWRPWLKQKSILVHLASHHW